MYIREPRKTSIFISVFLIIVTLGGGLFCILYLDSEFSLYEDSKAQSEEAFRYYAPDPFISSAAKAAPYVPGFERTNALYTFEAPEGFTIISYSEPWDSGMLMLLYDELKQNTHGGEIYELYEIIVHPQENDDSNTLATYSPGLSMVSFSSQFPAFPDDFRADIRIFTGIINIYGGDTKTTIESIAGSLSHEYGHHYTLYYMFDDKVNRQSLVGISEYDRLRESAKYGLVPNVDSDPDYAFLRHRYIIETAAEDYVILMGSPATRQTEDYYDVKQYIENPELPKTKRGERNAFPQENMSIPLAVDVPGLAEYFYGFIGAEKPVPVEEKQDIILQITRESEQYDLTTGAHTYVYYNITWNTPYQDTVYTLACYDPFDYSGYGIPIKTVRPQDRPTQSASAVIGDYAVRQGNLIHSMNDGLAQGIKVFYVVAQLPDGTYYMSEPHEFNFG